MTSRNRLARGAMLAWLVMHFTSASIGIKSADRFLVLRDPAATAGNIVQAESLFRIAIVGEMLTLTLFLLVGLMLHALFRDVQRDWARAMLVLVVTGAAIGFANCINMIAPLVLLRGGSFAAFTPMQLQQLAYGFMRLRGLGDIVFIWFLGLWVIPFGMLAARSGFVPRILTPQFIAFGVVQAAYALVALAAPAAAPTFFSFVVLPLGILGEKPMLLWLLVKGADGTRAALPVPVASAASRG